MESKKIGLIVFEGIDGSGKTTLSKMFCSFLKEKGIETVWLREPSDSPLGEKIRSLARSRNHIPIGEELDLFIRDRRWDVEHNIVPALQAGKTVVIDRYFYSNACYQGARGFDSNDIIRMNLEFAPLPDLVFIIDVDVETALNRIRKNRLSAAKLFEKKEFLKKVRENYLKLRGPNVILIDGAPELQSVFANIKRGYDDFCREN